tara:strand:+ start:378 stop:1058 length:681 start_codon:yes stop_codon:yes gene_type:complete
MKKILLLMLLPFFFYAENFKSWKADFTFSHHEFGNFNMKRNFIVKSEDNISSSFILRPLLIFKYSQDSSLKISDGDVRSSITEVSNNVPGVDPSYFKVTFENNLTSSKELNLNIERDEKILDQLGSDLQMRLNAKNGIKNFKLFVIDNDEGNIVERTYETQGNENIKTDFGTFECIKISATSLNGGKIIYFISPELDFMIIKSFVELKNGDINSLILKKMPKFLAE